MKRRKRIVPRRKTVQRAAREETPRQRKLRRQVLVCAALFVTLIALKLMLPGNLAAVRRTLGNWLVRDADFVAAFHAVGEAIGGAEELGTSLGKAYTAVFGAEEAVEVLAESDGTVMEQEILGFSTVSPLKGTLTSGFGLREDPNTGLETMHYGVDIAAQEGAEVCAFADGTVSVVGESTAWGKYLTVQHPGGYETLYAHCSAVTAKSGQSVAMGEVIAAVGQTGNATGPHLHFELHRDDDFLNPVYYFTDEA
ncbi:MAG: M23 family metallopeptidase [Oscillospiraceae bacterium]|nr:M23 family metallopeptidase [Oscillospiraceae bacterium]